MHEATLKYYRDQPCSLKSLSSHITFVSTEYKCRELIAWAEKLPPSMVLSEHSTPRFGILVRLNPVDVFVMEDFVYD